MWSVPYMASSASSPKYGRMAVANGASLPAMSSGTERR